MSRMRPNPIRVIHVIRGKKLLPTRLDVSDAFFEGGGVDFVGFPAGYRLIGDCQGVGFTTGGEQYASFAGEVLECFLIGDGRVENL